MAIPSVEALNHEQFPHQIIYMERHINMMEAVLRAYQRTPNLDWKEQMNKENVVRAIKIAKGIIFSLQKLIEEFTNASFAMQMLERLQPQCVLFDRVIRGAYEPVAEFAITPRPFRLTHHDLEIRIANLLEQGKPHVEESKAMEALRNERESHTG